MSKPLTITRGKIFSPSPRLVQMNPKLAESILNNNTMNRPLRKGRVERYARDMAAGDWQSNGETIKLTDAGDLLDGQHRLFAVIESGATVPMLVIEGLDPAVMHTIDTGAPRSFGDVTAIQGGKNTATVASALRWLYWFQSVPRPATMSGLRATHSELHALLAVNTDLHDRASEIGSTKMARRIVTPSVLCFVYTLAYRADPRKAGAWLAMIERGDGLDAKHPVLQLRERLLANRLATAKLLPLDVAALTIKSWNQYVTGKRTTNLRWASQESFPEIALSVGRTHTPRTGS